jgi:endonuclease/exonuclease/phosphatase family metal-dependent hydrolase
VDDVQFVNGDDHTLRTLGYNLFMRPSLWFIKNNDSDYKNERLALFLSQLDNYDIICLQEMFGLLSFRQRNLLAEAEKRGFSHAAVAGAPPYLFWDRHWAFKIPFLDAGLVILSRYPILRTDSHYYRLGNQIDGWSPKQVLHALVKLPGADNLIHVFNTHMQASYYDAPSQSSDLSRAKQINELAEFVKLKVYDKAQNNGKIYPALILGDFNLDARTHKHEGPHSLDYVRMMDVLQRELARPEEGVVGRFFFFFFPFFFFFFLVRDLLYESSGTHPITYGDVIEDENVSPLPRETVLTHTADHCCALSIDYALFLGPRETGEVVRHLNTRVEPFVIEEGHKTSPCTQLSDHYGLESKFLM